MQAKEGLQNEVEDQMTTEMILRAQAGDEHEVGADGNLVSGENTQAKLDAAAPAAGGVDTSPEKKDFGISSEQFLYS